MMTGSTVTEGLRQQYKILVVEDESIIARDLQKTLMRFGYDVPDTAATAAEAIEKASAMRPDLVLMDIVLSGREDGIRTAEEIQERWKIPHVYCTAYADDLLISRAKETHPLGFIVKPFEERELKAVLEVALHEAPTLRLRSEIERLAQAMAALGDGVLVVDASGMVNFMNPAAEHLTGWTDKEARGRLLAEVFPLAEEHPDSGSAQLTAELMRGEGWRGAVLRILFALRLGLFRAIEATSSPLLGYDGKLSGVVIAFRDVSDRRKWERSLQESDERFRMVAQATNAVIHDWDIIADRIDWNDGPEKIFGYPPEDVNDSSSWWTEKIHPADRQRVTASIDEAFRGRAKQWEAEYRFLKHDKSYAVVHDRGFIVYEDHSRPGRFVGCMSDISERKAHEAARAKQLRQERAIRSEVESAKLRVQFLAESGDILASSLDYNATLTRLAQHAVKTVCDWCAVGLVDEDGALRRVALAHRDLKQEAMANILRDVAPDPKSSFGLSAILARKEMVILTEFPPEQKALMKPGLPPEYLRPAAAHGFIPDPEKGSLFEDR